MGELLTIRDNIRELEYDREWCETYSETPMPRCFPPARQEELKILTREFKKVWTTDEAEEWVVDELKAEEDWRASPSGGGYYKY